MRVRETIKKILKFRNDREWEQFHKPKELAISLSIEASELLECFQWKSEKEVKEMLSSDAKSKVVDEIADVGNYLLLLCEELDVDLLEIIENKMAKNAEKYPIEKAKGSNKKYTEL